MKQVIALSLALTATLVASYMVWTDEAEEASDEIVTVYGASEADIVKLGWNSETMVVSIEKRTDARGDFLWVQTTETKKPKAPTNDPHEGLEVPPPEPAPTEPTEPPEVKSMTFLANSQGMDLWKSFAPLNALRELETGASIDRAVFELDPGKATVEVVRKSGPLSLTIGGETYGSKDRYVDHGGRVFLVDDATLRPLEYANSRLVERSLYPIAEKDTEKVVVTFADGTSRTWTQQNRDDAAKAFWAKPETPEAEDAAGGTWLGKLFRLKLRDYVDAAAAPAGLEPVLSYTVEGGKEAWKVELLKSTAGEKTEWYARTDYNRSVVSLTESLVRNVVDDIGTLSQ